MAEEGAPLAEIANRLGRTLGAVEIQIRRLGLSGIVCVSEKKNLPTIVATEILCREDALKALAAVIKKLKEGGETSELEMERLRIIVATVQGYFTVFNSYEKYAELEDRIRRLEVVAEQAAKKARKRVKRKG